MKLILISYTVKNYLKINFLNTFLYNRFIKNNIYIYLFFFKKQLFYLDFKKFRFKKIKRFIKSKQILVQHNKICNFKSVKKLVFLKKNASTLSLTKKFLRKSLYNNKFFNSRFFSLRKSHFRFHRKFKKKSLYGLDKFLIKYINIERDFFLKTFNLKKKKAQTTTKFVLKINKYKPMHFKQFIELSLNNFLLRTRFSLSLNHNSTLLNNKMVYVNSKLASKGGLILKKNDLVQLLFTKSFFYFYKYSYNLVFKRLSKLNYCVWRIQSSKKRKNKQQIKSFPSWLKNIFFFPYSIPKYLEVDFVSLSSVLIYEPVSTIDFNPYIYWNLNYFFYKVMSWKWIT